MHVDSIDQSFPFRCSNHVSEDFESRSLSRPIWSEEANALRTLDLQGEVRQCKKQAVTFRKVYRFDRRTAQPENLLAHDFSEQEERSSQCDYSNSRDYSEGLQNRAPIKPYVDHCEVGISSSSRIL